MPLGLTDDKSTLVQVMACCLMAPSHYRSQCWPRFMSSYGVTRPQWVDHEQVGEIVCNRFLGSWGFSMCDTYTGNIILGVQTENNKVSRSGVLSDLIWNSYWLLTHQRRVTHIYVSKQVIVGSNNGLSPFQRQAIIWPNANILSIGPLWTNFSEILIKIQIFSLKKCISKCCLQISGHLASVSICQLICNLVMPYDIRVSESVINFKGLFRDSAH